MVPLHPKLYHIVHVDRLQSIVAEGRLWCDAEVVRRNPAGTTIGMTGIKQRRLTELTLSSHPALHVGDCVPFYFCPRSVMLYLIYQGNHPELTYRGGQGPIIHLETDLQATVTWASGAGQRWAFTLSNAGSYFFEDRSDLGILGKSTGRPFKRGIGGPARTESRLSSLSSNIFPGNLSIGSVYIPSSNTGRLQMRCR